MSSGTVSSSSAPSGSSSTKPSGMTSGSSTSNTTSMSKPSAAPTGSGTMTGLSSSPLNQANKKLTNSELTSLESLVSSEAKGSLISTQKTQLTSLLSKAGITTSQLASTLESNQSSQSNQGGPSGSGGNPAGGGLFNNGSVGLFRLFNAELGPTSSWFLPNALFGLFIGFFATRKRKSKWYELTDKQKETLLWAVWLIPVGGFFSVAGFFHSYYLDMEGAPIAALTGISIVELVRSAKVSKTKLNWANIVDALILLATYSVHKPALIIQLIRFQRLSSVFWRLSLHLLGLFQVNVDSRRVLQQVFPFFLSLHSGGH